MGTVAVFSLRFGLIAGLPEIFALVVAMLGGAALIGIGVVVAARVDAVPSGRVTVGIGLITDALGTTGFDADESHRCVGRHGDSDQQDGGYRGPAAAGVPDFDGAHCADRSLLCDRVGVPT
ncbi:hypothetical protein AB0C34_14225 [Nocardia sp. NPDC049220]|uniref:hypothetical protein n=1 Tax=Nocardia sp. NPDC049220 TaxID=3155273 RepID=UPI0033DC9B8A